MPVEQVVQLGIGNRSKKLYVGITDHSLWQLQKIDLLAAEPFIRFIKREDAERIFQKINWGPISPQLGIVIHKAVVARVIKTMTLADAKGLINDLASKHLEGPIYDGFLSNEHGRLYLTSKDLGWGWRLQRTKPQSGVGHFYIERYNSKRTRPVIGDQVHLSVYASLLIPVHEFMSSVFRDLGSFADPYFSLHELKRKGQVIYEYIDVPLRNIPRQTTLTDFATGELNGQ